MSSARVAVVVLACLLALLASCDERSPLELLEASRANIELEVLAFEAWPRTPEPPAEGAEATEPKTATPEAADTEASAPEGEAAEPEMDALISLRVSDRGAPLELPCLTIEIVFLGGDQQAPTELGRERIELDLSGIRDFGGTFEKDLRYPLPEGAFGADVLPVEVERERLTELCEAGALEQLGE